MIKKITKRIRDFLLAKNGEALKYVPVGIATTLVNFGMFAVLTSWTHLGGTDLGVNIANVLSIAVSILFAYITNKWIVFRNHCDSRTELFLEFVKFVGARLITLVVEVGGVALLVTVWGMNRFAGKLLVQIVVFIGNYIISKFLVFIKKDAAGAQ